LLGVVLLDQINVIQENESAVEIIEAGIFGGRSKKGSLLSKWNI